jgi:ankyrin repeat protein
MRYRITFPKAAKNLIGYEQKNKIKTGLLSLFMLCFSTLSYSGNSEELTAACMKGDLEAAKKAIDAGADVNAKNSKGWNPISAAIFWPEITKLLIEKGADPSALDNAALSSASRTGSYKVMEILLNAGVAAGSSAIKNIVSSTSCQECLDLLIQKGSKLDAVGSLGGNLLDELAFSYLPGQDRVNNDKSQVKGWESMGFVVPDWYKNPDISKFGSADGMVRSLVKAGVNINGTNKLKLTPLLTSLGRYDQTREEVVLAFVNNGADVNVESPTQGWAILQAAGYGFTKVLEAMLAKGANLNEQFKVDDWVNAGQRLKGINPLMWAARNGNLEAVKLLVEKGSKLDDVAYGTGTNIKTKCLTSVKNKSAIYFAIESGNLDVVKYLVEKTSGDWKKAVSIKQMTQTSDIGFATVTSCFDNGSYTPSDYANGCKAYDIAEYLKSKKL